MSYVTFFFSIRNFFFMSHRNDVRQCWKTVVLTLRNLNSTLVQRRTPTLCRNCWKSDVGFCFIFKVGLKLFQRWFSKLKQRWSDVEILAGIVSNQKHISKQKSLWRKLVSISSQMLQAKLSSLPYRCWCGKECFNYLFTKQSWQCSRSFWYRC